MAYTEEGILLLKNWFPTVSSEIRSKIIKTACLKTKYFFCLVGRDFGTLVRVEDLVCVRQRLSAAVARERHQDRDRQSGEGRCQYTNVHWRLRGERVVLCDWEFILECNLQRGVKLFQLSWSFFCQSFRKWLFGRQWLSGACWHPLYRENLNRQE